MRTVAGKAARADYYYSSDYTTPPFKICRVLLENEMTRQSWAMKYQEPARLLGGSLGDWMVLVGGVLLAGLIAAAFAI